MNQALRQRVLHAFKKLHTTRKKVFEGDQIALNAARNRINEEYKKNINTKDESTINEMLKFSDSVEYELRTSVIQAKLKEPGVYELKITDDTVKLDNVPFKDECCQNKK